MISDVLFFGFLLEFILQLFTEACAQLQLRLSKLFPGREAPVVTAAWMRRELFIPSLLFGRNSSP